MPVLGLHFWLPKAHVEARTSGSIVLAGLLLKLGRYGALRILTIILATSLKHFVGIWLLATLVARLMTLRQTDVKKLIAYSRVTHITLIMVVLLRFNKSVFIVVVVLSLAHGWASIGIFKMGGILSHGYFSRLSILLGPEGKLHFLTLLFGLMLISNASIPPMPSFFPEVFIVTSLFSLSAILFSFILMRFIVCYYNVFLFLILSHMKQFEVYVRGFFINSYFRMLMLVTFRLVSIL
jgi:NADH-ubiquinone oxidoreductase chain 4